MSRYVRKAQSVILDPAESADMDFTLTPELTVDMHEARPTGILDKDGHEFMKLPDAIGFVRFS